MSFYEDLERLLGWRSEYILANHRVREWMTVIKNAGDNWRQGVRHVLSEDQYEEPEEKLFIMMLKRLTDLYEGRR